MVLCKAYWDHFKFTMPNEHKEDEYSRCNFICSLEHEGELKDKKIFCKAGAWHSLSNKITDHDFECIGTHKSRTFKKLEICFLVDITGSMHRFIEQCMVTTKKIIEDARSTNPNIELSFAVVGYRDHEMATSNITKKLKALIKEKKKKLKDLPVEPFHRQEFSEYRFNQIMI